MNGYDSFHNFISAEGYRYVVNKIWRSQPSAGGTGMYYIEPQFHIAIPLPNFGWQRWFQIKLYGLWSYAS